MQCMEGRVMNDVWCERCGHVQNASGLNHQDIWLIRNMSQNPMDGIWSVVTTRHLQVLFAQGVVRICDQGALNATVSVEIGALSWRCWVLMS